MPPTTRLQSRAASSASSSLSSPRSARIATSSPPKRARTKRTNPKFPYHLPWKRLDVRASPHLYRPGIGEQGVLMVRPYKDELLPHWMFKTPDRARQSATALLARFQAYRDEGDFVGCDMARKFLQMGYTRSRRYANHAGGRKYKDPTNHALGQLDRLQTQDPVKAESARIFASFLERAKSDPTYTRLRDEFLQRYADRPIPDGESDEIRSLLQDEESIEVRKDLT
ncbi:hypothetical protein ACQY0O_007923 [Thecaphora frezii]